MKKILAILFFLNSMVIFSSGGILFKERKYCPENEFSMMYDLKKGIVLMVPYPHDSSVIVSVAAYRDNNLKKVRDENLYRSLIGIIFNKSFGIHFIPNEGMVLGMPSSGGVIVKIVAYQSGSEVLISKALLSEDDVSRAKRLKNRNKKDE